MKRHSYGSATVAVMLVLTTGAACHRRSGSGGGNAAASVGAQPDSVRGVVSVMGTEFDKRTVIRGSPAARSIRLIAASAADSTALARLAGMDVVARGTNADDGFRVREFTALRMGAEPVADGVLRLDGSQVVLDTGSGRLTLGNPPDALRRMIGARVWISGPLATGPNAYGVITPVP